MKKFMACNKYPLAQSIQTLACILISFSSTNHQTLERIFHLNFINDFLNHIKKILVQVFVVAREEDWVLSKKVGLR